MEQLERIKAYAKDYRRVPIAKEIFADVRTVIGTLRVLKKVSRTAFLFESADNTERWGRYSFLGYDPKLELFVKNGKMSVKGAVTETFETDDPASVIRKVLHEYHSPEIPGMPTFTGGLVGYFAYEYARYSEKKLYFKEEKEPDISFNDADLMLFDKVIAFDHYRKTIILITNVDTSEIETNYEKAVRELDEMAELIAYGKEADIPEGKLLSDFKDEFTEEEYEALVREIQQRIHDGDIFQAVLSNGRSAAFEGSLLNAYRVLRTINPSPYMFYLSGHDIELAGASPETLIKLTGGELETFPIAGTMPRGKTDEEDEALEERLVSDKKELAEHNMLVDLGRNDIGKISRFGSVRVRELRKVKRFSHVMHLCSLVTGTIQEGKDALDALAAALPAGTMSGAPKIKAMEILHGMEKSPRGVYAGAVGYLSLTGNMDMCIGIRMAAAKGGRVFVRAGAGIVKDSVPKSEYRETRNKAEAMIEAVRKGQEAGDYDFTH